MEQKNKFISYLLILVSLFILIFFTMDIYENIQIKNDENKKLKIDKTNVISEFERKDNLNKSLKKIEEGLKENKRLILEGGTGSLSDNIDIDVYKDISKVNKTFREDKLIEYIYGKVSDYGKDTIKIENISFSKPIKNEIGFMEVAINIDLFVSTKDDMMWFLNSMLEDGEYKFFINEFSYPNDGTNENFTVSIPLKMYYK